MSKDTSKLYEIVHSLAEDIADQFGGDLNEHPQTELEQQAKADLLAWHREECLRIIGEDETQHPNEPYKNTEPLRTRNKLRAKQRASLEVER